MNLSKSAQRVQDAIIAAGCKFSVVELPGSTRTADESAITIGCELGQIVKSLIFKGKESGKPVLVLVSGKNRVKEKRVAQCLGEKLSKADADFTRTVTGFAIGGIPPLGHLEPLITFIDEDLLEYETVWAAAGTPHAVFSLPSYKLPELTSGQVITIK
ncbi:membrane protein [Pseudoalteromonas luteoviolacea]|uniref:Membrane protein n=1 Tax=Pseudoalteromonas luteoviolacea TaxID=43657 RepID=A0A023Q176_9GAMM|nr:YbaK/EbsC family protein [Pseudoalteromonas luteoviolacea]AHX39946.1 YbaK/prolyl-tRNA synthetase associated region [Pseudoalteromonas luteoviolacea]KID56037.1 membrane protein [Pseudoalteromonas luteoviolacea]